MFDQLSEDFSSAPGMEGVPTPPPEFLKAFLKHEVWSGAQERTNGSSQRT